MDWIGDGFCDDHLNNFQCGFDGEDCCLPDFQHSISHSYCQICACIGKGGIQIYTTLLPSSDFEIDIAPPIAPPWIPTEPNWLLPGKEIEETMLQFEVQYNCLISFQNASLMECLCLNNN